MTKYSEDWHQQQAVMWFRNDSKIKGKIGSIPNDGKDRKEQMRKLNTGMLPGASDLFIILENGKTIWVEMKTPDGRQSPSQKKFENDVTELGHIYLLCFGFEDFKEKVILTIKKFNEKLFV